MSHTPIRALVATLIAAMPTFVALAQEVQDESAAPAHDRHLHKHNPDHATADDRSRFFTNRSSDIVLPLPGEEDAFSFVVYGDRTGGPDSGINILKDAVRDTNLLEPDFVMTVGDMIDGYNETDAWMAQMREFKGVMDELICPWFPVAGNHDIYYRGEGRTPDEHEPHYEMHFGPLWYAFEHKNCFFIILYTDEGNPETGERNFRKAASQEMSPEQLAWLGEMLDKGKDAQHVFLFMHHPRWIGGNYGDSWNTVHDMLVKAGNVSAVFAGHIHRMRYDPRDGIEYVTLATVGGHQNKVVPDAGWLHHYNIVTVRPNQVAHAALPVGQVIDVRELTSEVADQAMQLARESVTLSPALSIDSTGVSEGEVKLSFRNPTEYTVDYTLMPESRDSRWVAWPDHLHGSLEPGEELRASFQVAHSGGLDDTYRDLAVLVDAEMLLPGHRYRVPTIEADVPVQLDVDSLSTATEDLALVLDGHSSGVVQSDWVKLPDGPLTLEAWFTGEDYNGRRGLVTKTEGSEYGLFVTDGKPGFSIHIGGSYLNANLNQAVLEPGTRYHLAGVYDGSQARLYLDGKLVASNDKTGARRLNSLPLIIGGDVSGAGQPTSEFTGTIEAVRLSSTTRYTGEAVTPADQWETDDATVLLFDMDRKMGPWLIDESGNGAHAKLVGKAKLE